MSEERELNYRRVISHQHLEILAEYMERYPALALGSARSKGSHVEAKRTWEKIARTLNKIDENVTKSGKSWARYWIDLKFKLRRKYSALERRGEGHARLSSLEQRFLRLLTDGQGRLVPTTSLYNQLHYVHLDAFNTKQDAEDKITDSGGDPDDCIPLNHIADSTNIEIKPAEQTQPKTVEDLKRELLDFELKRQRELFEIEKKYKREKHTMEMEILTLKKEVVLKELRS